MAEEPNLHWKALLRDYRCSKPHRRGRRGLRGGRRDRDPPGHRHPRRGRRRDLRGVGGQAGPVPARRLRVPPPPPDPVHDRDGHPAHVPARAAHARRRRSGSSAASSPTATRSRTATRIAHQIAACGPLSIKAILRAWRETEHMSATPKRCSTRTRSGGRSSRARTRRKARARSPRSARPSSRASSASWRSPPTLEQRVGAARLRVAAATRALVETVTRRRPDADDDDARARRHDDRGSPPPRVDRTPARGRPTSGHRYEQRYADFLPQQPARRPWPTRSPPPRAWTFADGVLDVRVRFGARVRGPARVRPRRLRRARVRRAASAWCNVLNGQGGLTGRLTVRYRKPTPLRPRAAHDRVASTTTRDRRMRVRGTIHAGDVLTAEAEGPVRDAPRRDPRELLRRLTPTSSAFLSALER